MPMSRLAAGTGEMSLPFTVTEPASAISNPASIRSAVVLPQPEATETGPLVWSKFTIHTGKGLVLVQAGHRELAECQRDRQHRGRQHRRAQVRQDDPPQRDRPAGPERVGRIDNGFQV